MVTTATAGDCADREAVNAKYAATIPPVCKRLPITIETRQKTLRLALSDRLTGSPFKASPADSIVATPSRYCAIRKESAYVKRLVGEESGLLTELAITLKSLAGAMSERRCYANDSREPDISDPYALKRAIENGQA